MWRPAPVEVVIPGCFRGALVGGTPRLPRPAGRVGCLSNRACSGPAAGGGRQDPSALLGP